MTDPVVSACPHCGGTVGEFHDIEHSRDRVAICENGHEVLVHGIPFIPEQWADESGPRLWRAIVRWPDRAPSKEDIIALRKLSPQLAQHSLVEVGKKVREDRELEIARHVIGDARQLQEEAAKLGIAVEQIPISRPDS
jgi:hypothetical protein